MLIKILPSINVVDLIGYYDLIEWLERTERAKLIDIQEIIFLGKTFASKGYDDIALDFFTKAVGIDYTYPEAYIELGKFLYNQRRFGDALRVWQVGVKNIPYDVQLKGLITKAQAHEIIF